jgi:hypothetical protein
MLLLRSSYKLIHLKRQKATGILHWKLAKAGWIANPVERESVGRMRVALILFSDLVSLAEGNQVRKQSASRFPRASNSPQKPRRTFKDRCLQRGQATPDA